MKKWCKFEYGKGWNIRGKESNRKLCWSNLRLWQRICLTSCGIKPENLDEHIVSGFFTAIKKFGQKLIPGTVVKSLIMSGHKLFYNNFENITFCIQCYDDLPNQVIDYILNRISNQFLEIYQEHLPIRDGNISIFSDFSTYLSQFMYGFY